ncbi:MAG: NADH:flavin oxidoreductase [Planctomycetes bacterium]|nr:NADH:flavin oxidoreductase [Planctomycetota bacterium]
MKYPKLFEPFRIKSMTLENRTLVTAMVTRLSGADGFVNNEIRERYVRFAMGEPGIIIVEAMGVHDYKSGQLLRISNDEFIPGLRDLANKVHDTSPTKIAPQIIHFLKIAKSGWRQTIYDLTKDDIKLIIKQYAEGAHRARTAGFDGVELHMAHAYTLSSFLSMKNNRKDEYGGTLENRMRLMTEVIQACRSQVGNDFPIGVRFDGEECIRDGYGLMDSREIALRIAKLGADWISISAGGKFEDAIKKEGQPIYPYTGYSGDRCMPPATYQDGYNLYLGAGIRDFLLAKGYKTPIVVTGKIRTPEHAEQILSEGKGDIIGFARTVLADPDWPKKARSGNDDKIIKCISINVCKALDENFKKVKCYFWPKNVSTVPFVENTTAPKWPVEGAQLKAEQRTGVVRLTWNKSIDTDKIYAYDIFRSVDGGPFEFLWATRADMKPMYDDGTASGGSTYTYYTQALDMAGNRTEKSNSVAILVPLPVQSET